MASLSAISSRKSCKTFGLTSGGNSLAGWLASNAPFMAAFISGEKANSSSLALRIARRFFIGYPFSFSISSFRLVIVASVIGLAFLLFLLSFYGF
jgi:hypothetical protein